jgi:hypothetical protein
LKKAVRASIVIQNANAKIPPPIITTGQTALLMKSISFLAIAWLEIFSVRRYGNANPVRNSTGETICFKK